jgi:Flp pilus assembly protein TadG
MRTKTRDDQCGAVLVELGFLLPIFTLLLLAVFDIGMGYYYALEVSNAAKAGAQYGYQSSATMMDTTGIKNTAKNDGYDVTNSSGGKGSATWNSGYPTSTWGCMCSDGTQKTPSCGTTLTCSTNSRQVNYVDVQTRASYQTLVPWPGIPSTVTLKGETLLWAGQ